MLLKKIQVLPSPFLPPPPPHPCLVLFGFLPNLEEAMEVMGYITFQISSFSLQGLI